MRIFIIPAEGGTPQELLPGDTNDDDANWGPDGDSIVFAHEPLFGSANPNDFVLQRFDLKTAKVSNLPGSTGMYGPRCSPDGRYISALTVDQQRLRLFEVATGQWSELATGQNIEYPNWSQDGRYLYFEDTGAQGRELLRVKVSTRQPERVLSLREIKRPRLPFGEQWSGLAADDSPLIMRDVGNREIYALDAVAVGTCTNLGPTNPTSPSL